MPNSKTFTIKPIAECKNNIARILKQNGRVICCGWNTNGLGKNRGFEMTNILIIPHGGSKNDTLITLEYKRNNRQ